jgi:hypothetical protein
MAAAFNRPYYVRITSVRRRFRVLNKLVFENLRQRPVRTCLSVLAIGVEVTMMLTLVGISYGTLHEAARRARGVSTGTLTVNDARVRTIGPRSLSRFAHPSWNDLLSA